MKYYLVEFSEINCTVTLEEDGTLDVEQDSDIPNDPYSFKYLECDDHGNCEEQIWDSTKELHKLPEQLKEVEWQRT